MGSKYRNKPCGYCGRNTGPDGEGEHVLPKCLYPKSTDPRVQRLKIPSCPNCNNSWEKDEAHFRNVIVACGPEVTGERKQLWEKSVRNFYEPLSGKGDFWAFASHLVSSPVLNEYGHPYRRLIPCSDPRAVRVLQKIIRGLAHHHNCVDVISEDRVILRPAELPLPKAFFDDLTTIFTVPHVFAARAAFTCAKEDKMHSLWVLEFLDSTSFYGFIEPLGKNHSK